MITFGGGICEVFGSKYSMKLISAIVFKKKSATPSLGIIDSQSTKTILASEEISIDGGKKVKGRKRHIVVDTMGHLLQVAVHAANQHDTTAAPSVLDRATEKYPRIKAFSTDAGYRGITYDFVQNTLHKTCHISMKIKDTFAVLPIRWIVEEFLLGLETLAA